MTQTKNEKIANWTPIPLNDYVMYSDDLDIDSVDNIRAIQLPTTTDRKGNPEMIFRPVLKRMAKNIDNHNATDKEFLLWMITYYQNDKHFAIFECFDRIALNIFHKGYHDSYDLFLKIDRFMTAENLDIIFSLEN